MRSLLLVLGLLIGATGVADATPDIAVSVDGLPVEDGGTVDLGPLSLAPTAHAIEIANLGDTTLHIENDGILAVAGGGAALTLSLAGADIVFLDFGVLTLTADVPGPFSADLVITSNDPDENPFTYTVTGTFVPTDPALALRVGGVDVAEGNEVLAGERRVGTVHAWPFTVRNTGDAGLTYRVASITSSTNCAVTFDGEDRAVGVDGADQHLLLVTPEAEGEYGFTVTLASDAPAQPTFVFDVRGHARTDLGPVAITAPLDVIQTDAYHFTHAAGDLPRGVEAAIPVRLRNTGDTTLTIASTSCAGVGVDGLTCPMFPVFVPSQGEAETIVRFTPRELGELRVEVELQTVETFCDAVGCGGITLAITGWGTPGASVELLRDGEPVVGGVDLIEAIAVGEPVSLPYRAVEASGAFPVLVVDVTCDVTATLADPSCPTVLSAGIPAGEGIDFAVGFTPTEPGPFAFTLRVRSSTAPDAVVTIAGTAVHPRVSVDGPHDYVASGFEELVPGVWRILNDGPVDATVTAIVLAGAQPYDFALPEDLELPFTLRPGELRELTISYIGTKDEVPSNAGLGVMVAGFTWSGRLTGQTLEAAEGCGGAQASRGGTPLASLPVLAALVALLVARRRPRAATRAGSMSLSR